MIKRQSKIHQIPLEDRCPKIIDILFYANEEWMSATDITKQYVENYIPSDIHVTTTICNILSYSGVLEKKKTPEGEPIRVFFRLKRGQ